MVLASPVRAASIGARAAAAAGSGHGVHALNLYSEVVYRWDAEKLITVDVYVQEIAEAVRQYF